METTLKDVKSIQPVDTGVRYSDAVKELCYQMWAFIASRNGSQVFRLLQSGEYGELDQVPTIQMINCWAREYGWADRSAQEIEAIAPDLRHQVFSELLFGGLAGAKYLRRVADGLEDNPNIIDIPKSEDAGVNYDRLMARVKSHDAARKARIAASIAAVDRIGFSPIGRGTSGVAAPRGAGEQPDFASMSIDELRDFEYAMRKRRGDQYQPVAAVVNGSRPKS